MASDDRAVVIEANVFIAIASGERNRDRTATEIINPYASEGRGFYAPGTVISECLYALCNKLTNGVLDAAQHAKSIQTFLRLIEDVLPPPNGDRVLAPRAEQIRHGYGCSRSADGLYIALAEELAKTMSSELLAFDHGIAMQAAANAPTVRVRLL